MPKLTKRSVDELPADGATRFVWDSELKGFGVRVGEAGAKAYVVQYRTRAGRSRRMTLGRHGVLTVDEARAKARKVLVAVSDGADPMADRSALRAAPTVNELLDRHIDDHVKIHNSPRMLELTERDFNRFARPALGSLKVESVTLQDVSKLHLSLRETPRQANLLIALLSKAFGNAEVWGMRPKLSNPCRGVKRYEENHRERFLSAAELKRLGAAIREAETVGLPWEDDGSPKSRHLAKPENRRTLIARAPLDIILTLLFTGARLSEICELKWEHVDLEARTLRLPGRKGGVRKTHPVGTDVLELLAGITRVDDSPWVFPRTTDPSRQVSKEVVENAWQRLRKRADIEDVRLHDLRHTVGTVAGRTGVSSFAVRDLLRHASTAMTNKYVNFDAEPVRELSDHVGARIAASLAGTEAKVIPLKKKRRQRAD
ncbi:site-specific integrase [Methylosinus sp. KRF6]|uniref:site-specific integrase n=1 Tax=Methylosinus sp. KRF6 TaxID=2846853 RepID=UPI001C0D0D50|nr:site-specific integrase [Methylosinus sp. KRF6]MBU3887198.1 site-specific integrase [Methylosinus sp. KRF6]